VYSIALRYSGDPAMAMDIAQDTFLKLLSRIGDFRGESRFETCCTGWWQMPVWISAGVECVWEPLVENIWERMTPAKESVLEA